MTTIPTVKAALVALARTALPTSQAIYGPVTGVTTTGPRLVAVGQVTGTRELDALTLTTTLERYVITVAVSVDLPGTDQQTAEEMALADYAALEAAIRADITLGLPGTVQVIPTGTFDLLEQADPDGRHAVVLFSVNVTAQN
jgi:hypothetical protein